MVGRPLRPARQVPRLVMPAAEHSARVPSPASTSASSVAPALTPRVLGRLAADALRGEAWLTPKPGLVDQRGSNAHGDMDLVLLLRSAAVLEPWFARAAEIARTASRGHHADLRLRRDLGRLGRQAEAEMLATTGGVNTHRGALFSLGFLVAGAAVPMSPNRQRSRRPQRNWRSCLTSPCRVSAHMAIVFVIAIRASGPLWRQRPAFRPPFRSRCRHCERRGAAAATSGWRGSTRCSP